MRPAQGGRVRLRQAEVLHLALGDQGAHGARDLLDRHVRIDPVLIEEVDHLHAQTLQGSLRYGADMLRAAVQAVLLAGLWINIEAELGGDHHLIAHRRQRLAHHLFIGERAIDLGGVEEGDAAFRRRADQGDPVRLAERMTVAEIQPHAAKAQGRNLQAALTQYALFHRLFLIGGRGGHAAAMRGR